MSTQLFLPNWLVNRPDFDDDARRFAEALVTRSGGDTVEWIDHGALWEVRSTGPGE